MSDFKKQDQHKPRLDLLPPRATVELGHVLTMGAEKYGPDNWRKGGTESIPRYIAAGLRHVFAYMGGETHDQESGRHHLVHAVASLMFVVELEGEDEGGNHTPNDDSDIEHLWLAGSGSPNIPKPDLTKSGIPEHMLNGDMFDGSKIQDAIRDQVLTVMKEEWAAEAAQDLWDATSAPDEDDRVVFRFNNSEVDSVVAYKGHGGFDVVLTWNQVEEAGVQTPSIADGIRSLLGACERGSAKHQMVNRALSAYIGARNV